MYTTFREAAQALGLLHDDAEGQLCFNEARDSGYSPVQLRALLVTLIVDGDEHRGDILESNREILTADLEVSLPYDVVLRQQTKRQTLTLAIALTVLPKRIHLRTFYQLYSTPSPVPAMTQPLQLTSAPTALAMDTDIHSTTGMDNNLNV